MGTIISAPSDNKHILQLLMHEEVIRNNRDEYLFIPNRCRDESKKDMLVVMNEEIIIKHKKSTPNNELGVDSYWRVEFTYFLKSNKSSLDCTKFETVKSTSSSDQSCTDVSVPNRNQNKIEIIEQFQRYVFPEIHET